MTPPAGGRSLSLLRGMTLRGSLVALTLATLLPVAILAAGFAYFLVEQQRDTFRRGAEERTLAMMTAVDAKLGSARDALVAFSTARAFETDDLGEIRERAARVLATQEDWATINLAAPSGQQLMNLLRPPGAPLPDISQATGDWERGIKDGRPWVSDLIEGPATGQWDFAVRVPIVRGGSLKYVLSAAVKPESISRLLQAQNVPSGWVAVVLDRNNRIVARTVEPKESVGKPASDSLREALARSPAGWFHGFTIEEVEVYTPYRRSPATGWTFAMGIPAAAVDATARRALLLLGVSMIGAIALALLLASLIGRRISRPISSLALATAAFGRGEPAVVPQNAEIDEIRMLARTLQHSIEQIQAGSRAKDEFLAMLSHELRNPLAALSTAAYVLRVSAPAGERAANARGVITRQADHMAKLIEDLLDISRVTIGKMDLAKTTFDLGEAVTLVVDGWRASGRLGRHQVSVLAERAWIDADRTRVEQMLSNLLDNALKFTPYGDAVRVSVSAGESGALLSVSDAGEGIAAQDLGRIFEPFVQGEQGLDRSRGGMGIGLALVKRLAELHGGSVAAASEGPGKGATLTVRFPIAAPPQRMPPAPTDELGSPSRRVLIIEDNDDARRMLRDALAEGGFEVHEAANGVGGVELAAIRQPDVALVDIGLPDIDGYEVARRMREGASTRAVALVALTGYGQAEDRTRSQQAGFDAHLTKPVALDQLTRMIASMRFPR